jgi:transcriptional regulator with XRE-family HTH domain
VSDPEIPAAQSAAAVAAKAFGEKVAEVRTKAGVSQDQLADWTSLDRTTISLLESGKRQPRLSTIIQIAGALDIRPCELIEGLSWTRPTERPGELRYNPAE